MLFLKTARSDAMMMNDWAGMTGFGLGHWVIFVVMVAAVLYPIGRILQRIGVSPFWSILALIPLVNLIALWFLAFADWRADGDKGTA
jgi:hypothetical protein